MPYFRTGTWNKTLLTACYPHATHSPLSHPPCRATFNLPPPFPRLCFSVTYRLPNASSLSHVLIFLYRIPSGQSVNTSLRAFVDLKGAFDWANKDVIIIDELILKGVKGRLLGWIRDYLYNRTAQVWFQGAVSSEEVFELEKPEGGVLSPIYTCPKVHTQYVCMYLFVVC